MALIQHPIDDNIVYDIPNHIIQDLAQIGTQRGLGPLIDALNHYLPHNLPARNQRPILTFNAVWAGRAVVERLAEPTPAPTLLFEPNVAPSRPRTRKKKVVEETLETLKTPIIAELNEDGTKKLFKTRYQDLEKQYIALHTRLGITQREATQSKYEVEKLMDDNYRLTQSLKAAKDQTVDGEKVSKLVDRLCKETGTVLIQDDFRGLSVDERLERFFGTILCRIRTEVVADELAD